MDEVGLMVPPIHMKMLNSLFVTECLSCVKYLFIWVFMSLSTHGIGHITFPLERSKVKVGVLRPVQQPGSYWDRSSELPLVGLEPTEVTAYD